MQCLGCETADAYSPAPWLSLPETARTSRLVAATSLYTMRAAYVAAWMHCAQGFVSERPAVCSLHSSAVQRCAVLCCACRCLAQARGLTHLARCSSQTAPSLTQAARVASRSSSCWARVKSSKVWMDLLPSQCQWFVWLDFRVAWQRWWRRRLGHWGRSYEQRPACGAHHPSGAGLRGERRGWRVRNRGQSRAPVLAFTHTQRVLGTLFAAFPPMPSWSLMWSCWTTSRAGRAIGRLHRFEGSCTVPHYLLPCIT